MDKSPYGDCRAALAGTDWPPDVEGATGSGPAGSCSAGRDSVNAAETADEPPGEQSKADYLWQSLLYDAANTGRFVGLIAGFAASFFVSVLVLVPVVEFFLGPWDSQSDQVAWAVIVASLVLAWYLYKTGKRLVVFLRRSAVGRVRSAAGE